MENESLAENQMESGAGNQTENGREQPQTEEGTVGNIEEEEEEIYKLYKTPSIDSIHSGPDVTECSICYRGFSSSALTTLPCGHSFDSKCIIDWTQVFDFTDFRNGRVRCPMCRSYLLYNCGDVISRHHLRPGITILPQELTLNCQSYVPETDTHSTASSERPWNPQTYAAAQRPQNQQANNGNGNNGNGNNGNNVNPVNPANPTNQGNVAIDDLSEQEEVEGPPNTVQGDDDNNSLDQQMAQVALQGNMAERPKHYDFKFLTRVAEELDPDSESQTLDEYKATKQGVAAAIDDRRFEWIENIMNALKDDFQRFEDAHPLISIAVPGLMFRNLEMLARRVVETHEVYKRQHEGFIELSDVAVKFRAEKEDIMHEQLDEFWNLFDHIDYEIQRKYDMVEAERLP